MNLSLRSILVFAASASALAAAGCKSSRCSPPCATPAPSVTPSPCAPPTYAPAPVARPVARAPMPAVRPALPPTPPPPPPAELAAMSAEIEARRAKLAETQAELDRVLAERAGPPAADPSLEAVRGKSQAEEAARRLADELKGMPGVQVLVEGTSTVVVLTDSFASGSDKLKTDPNLRSALRGLTMAISRHPEARVSVVGHTDSTPIKRSSWPDNAALSKARAEVVAGALASDGVGRDRLRVDGAGERDPLVTPEASAADRAKNRRVEIEFAFASQSS